MLKIKLLLENTSLCCCSPGILVVNGRHQGGCFSGALMWKAWSPLSIFSVQLLPRAETYQGEGSPQGLSTSMLSAVPPSTWRVGQCTQWALMSSTLVRHAQPECWQSCLFQIPTLCQDHTSPAPWQPFEADIVVLVLQVKKLKLGEVIHPKLVRSIGIWIQVCLVSKPLPVTLSRITQVT